jgi:hypothetical protein
LILLLFLVAPSVKPSTQLLGAPVESNVLLQCIVESFPKPLNSWLKSDGTYIILCSLHNYVVFIFVLIFHFSSFSFFFFAQISNNTISGTKLYPGEKYIITEISITNSYTWQMNLTVKNVQKNDFGAYICIGENAFGKSDSRIRLQGIICHFGFFYAKYQVCSLSEHTGCNYVKMINLIAFLYLPELYLPPKPTTTQLPQIFTTVKPRRKNHHQSHNIKANNDVLRPKEPSITNFIQENEIVVPSEGEFIYYLYFLLRFYYLLIIMFSTKISIKTVI